MVSLTRSLNYELPTELQFDKYAQHILENSRSVAPLDTSTRALASTPSITSLDTVTHQTTTSEFLKKLGATFIHSIQLQTFHKANPLESSSIPSVSIPVDSSSISTNMDLDFTPNHLIMDSLNFKSGMDELQKQLEYDKFMNEVWIGIVLTLVLISMIFCFCSCFLYHQFRMWKRNYRSTTTESNDTEAYKINLDFEDPVPEYTLVSGLPSYDAALELLHKNPQSCLLVHPSVFEIFSKNEKTNSLNSPTSTDLIESQTPTESSMPLLSESSSSASSEKKLTSYKVAILPSYSEATSSSVSSSSPTTRSLPYNNSLANILTLTSQKSQSKNKSNPTTPTAACGSEKAIKS